MAKLTWRGPDDYEAGETPPSSCTWNGITFPVGVAVEVDNLTMIAKARGNRMFKVGDETASAREDGRLRPDATQWREPATEADPADAPDVSFFDDPPEVPLDRPPDYPPEDEQHQGVEDARLHGLKRKPGRPRNVRKPNNGDDL